MSTKTKDGGAVSKSMVEALTRDLDNLRVDRELAERRVREEGARSAALRPAVRKAQAEVEKLRHTLAVLPRSPPRAAARRPWCAVLGRAA